MVNGFEMGAARDEGWGKPVSDLSGRISDEAVTRTFRPDLLGSGFQTDPSIKHSDGVVGQTRGGYPWN